MSLGRVGVLGSISKITIDARGKESSLRNNRILKFNFNLFNLCQAVVFLVFFFSVVIEMCQPVSLTDELTK